MKWTAQMDASLVAAVNLGMSRRQAAALIGVSRNAAIARWHRIIGHAFMSDIERGQLGYAQTLQRHRLRDVAERFEMSRADTCGLDRNAQIQAAIRHGVRLAVVARHFDLTVTRVWQIANELTP